MVNVQPSQSGSAVGVAADEQVRSDVVSLVATMTDRRADEAKKLLIKACTRFKKHKKDIPFGDYPGLPPLAVNGGHVRAGGSGIVFQVKHRGLPNRQYALKLVRPSLLGGGVEQAAAAALIANEEALRTSMLAHPNVGNLIGLAKVPIQWPGTNLGVNSTATLLEWVEGARTLSAYVYEECASLPQLINLFRQFLGGLGHIHERGFIHWDIKSANCLVSRSGTLKIMDVGNAREIHDAGTTYFRQEEAFTSLENAPPRFVPEATTVEPNTKRIPVTLTPGTSTLDRPWLDLYMAGRMIGRILGFEPERDASATIARERFLKRIFRDGDDQAKMALAFLRRIVDRLAKPIAIDPQDDAELTRYYTSAEDVDADLSKLLPEFGAARDVTELYAVPQHVIRIPVNRNIAFSRRVGHLINARPLKRLEKHLQLGLTHWAYPGAHHVRIEHIVGVLGATLDYVRALYADRDSADFRLLIDSRHVRALIFASIVHDVGHGAFSHYLEECESLFKGCSHEDYVQALLRNDPSLYAATGSQEDFRTDREALERCVSSDAWLADGEGVGDFLLLVADILNPGDWPNGNEPDLTDGPETELTIRHLLHSVIDGALDADKLDYLRRDAYHGALDYAQGADVDRFLQSLTVAVRPPSYQLDELNEGGHVFRPTIAISRKGVLPAESLLVARYQLFNSLYWHRTARGATVIVQYLAWRFVSPRSQRLRRERVSELMTRLRWLDDKEALHWLAQQVAQESTRVDHIRALEQSATERDELPQPICELNYPELQPGGSRRSQYERILRLHEVLNRQPGEVYSRYRSRIIESLCKGLRRRVVSLHPKVASAAAELDEATIFPDVPLQFKDQVENLYVASSGVVTDFYQHSPMAAAIRDAFRIWSRRIRIFVMPAIREALLSYVNEDQLQDAAFESLLAAYDSVVTDVTLQPPLFRYWGDELADTA
jgi:HD superfamily phosphohydrolase